MRILVTGGSSFIGAHFCLQAVERHQVFAVHHRTALRLNGVTPVRADLRRDRDLDRLRALAPDVVVHLAAKIIADPIKDVSGAEVAADANRHMMDGVLALGVPVLYGSSTVVHWSQETPYGQVRREDESRLRASGQPYAIIRPCAPYGPRLATHRPRHKESFQRLVDVVRASPVVPVIGDGQYRRQPIHTEDLNQAMLALLDAGLKGQELDAGGGDALPFDQIIQVIAGAAGRAPRLLHLPKSLVLKVAHLIPGFEPTLLGAVDTDEVADPAPLKAATGVAPRAFADGVRDLL